MSHCFLCQTIRQITPEYTSESERLRLSCGAQALIIAWMVGKATPSPNPIRALTSSNGGNHFKAAARGVRSVKRDQTITPPFSIILGETVPLARYPPTKKLLIVWPALKALCARDAMYQ